MYIKLGSINLQYYQETNDWMILGEILDSGMSYEKPILVKTTDELDIWFGKDYKDYSYMQELINMGIVLYLYKPISDKTIGGTNYIDLDSYVEDDEVWLRDVELDWIEKVLKSPEIYKFQYNNGVTIKDTGLVVNSDGSLSITNNVSGRNYCTEEVIRTELLKPINQISRIHKSPIKFHVLNYDSLWIYHEDKILNVDLLPQNLNLTSNSSNNRDTLVVSQPEDKFEFTYLDYNSETEEFGIFHDKSLIDSLPDIDEDYKDEINMTKVAEGYQTLILKISGGPTLDQGDYFVFPEANHGTDTSKWRIFYTSSAPEEVINMFPIERRTHISTILGKLNDPGTLIGELDRSMRYEIIEIEKGKSYYLYSKTILPVTNYYKSLNINVTPETKITEAIISRYITPGIEAVSKTIGRSSEFEDDLIQLVIEKSNDNYRTTISRYSYTEVFEGSLKFIPGELRLDNLITQQSKLIRCNFYGEELRPGTYYLMGAVTENTNPEMYKYSLKQMLSTEYNDPVYPDYFLIPDKYKYTSEISEDSPYPLFLNYSKEIGCQFLIENKSYSEFKVVTTINTLPIILEKYKYYKVKNYYDWEGNHIEDPSTISKDNEIITVPKLPEKPKEGVYYLIETYYDWNRNKTIGDYIYNLVDDQENRLVYFFKPMTYKYEDRSGYYVYLRGLLLNDYSISVKDILYETPTQDAFLEENIEKELKTYKSNYLVCDNQTYFYKDYQDGDSYTTTGWTRFIAGKIFRELQKNSGDILGQQLLGKIRSNITDLLTSITSGFSIVKSISITEFEPSDNGQSLKITLQTVMNDLVKNNVDLDITVNYNNITYGTIS